MSEYLALSDDTVESFDLGQFLDSAFSLTDLSTTNNGLLATEHVGLDQNEQSDQISLNPSIAGSFIWQDKRTETSNNYLDSSGPNFKKDANKIGCLCVEMKCSEKLTVLRQRQRRILAKKNYHLKTQQKLIDMMRSTIINGNDIGYDNQEMHAYIPTLPMVLAATQRNLEKYRHRPCWTALIETTYVLRKEIDPEDYATSCPCLQHDCKKTLNVLKEFQEKQNNRQNQKLLQKDRLIGQLEAASQEFQISNA